jgi:adenylate cyclase
MMIRVYVRNAAQNQQFDASADAFELGRGPQRDLPRITIQDQSVSRDQLRIERLDGGRVRLRNLSQNRSVLLAGGAGLGVGASSELTLPTNLRVGDTEITLSAAEVPPPVADETCFDQSLYLTIAEPARLSRSSSQRPLLKVLGDAPSVEKITQWLESVVGLQRAPAGSKEFYDQTARALVEFIDLELGMVVLRHGDNKWKIAGYCAANDRVNSRYSRTLLSEVVRQRRTFYQDTDTWKIDAASLASVEAVVVSPIFDMRDEVAGVLYASRTTGGAGRGKIRPLEAQVVQLLAAGVSDNLARTEAAKTQARFEQFFSAELARELERNPELLEGRNQEVTILSSDLRGFTSMSERIGPEITCRITRDVMERLSEPILGEGGVIVDYAGDGILAMWNAPVPQPDHVERACRAALAMLNELPGLNATWQKTTGGALAIGVGLNTGIAQVGNTGSSRKLKYGPHGLTVNLASRVQDATKKFGVPALMSRSVCERASSEFGWRSVGTVELKGISEAVELFQLYDAAATLRPDVAASLS